MKFKSLIVLGLLSLTAPRGYAAAGDLVTPHILGQTMVVLGNGRVLIAGGLGTTFTNSAFAEEFDVAQGSWIATASMTLPRQYHTATVLLNGKVLVTGGYSTSGMTASCELYDPIVRTWTSTASMATARAAHTATLLPDGRVLVAGGPDASTEIFDPSTLLWSPAATMNSARTSHSAVLLKTGKVLVAGGYGTASQLLKTTELYDPTLNSWALTGSLFTGHVAHSTTLLNDGRVLVAGGVETPETPDMGFNNLCELYDPQAGTWSLTGAMTEGSDHSATLLTDGRVLIAGGETIGPSGVVLQKTAEVFDPIPGLWTPTGSMNVARQFLSSVLLTNGKPLVAGGTTSEVYDPNTGQWSAPPQPPQNLQASVQFTTATLTWDPVPTATAYQVYASTTPGREMIDRNVILPTVQTNSAVIPHLNGGIPWYFVVTAFDPTESAPSAEVSALPVSTTYYVDPAGNDSNPGTFSQPFKTLTQAIHAVVAGDTLLVNPGIYQETFNVGSFGWLPSTADHPVTIRASNPANRPVIKCNQDQVIVTTVLTPYTTLDGFVIDADTRCDTGISVQTSHASIMNSEIKSALLEGIDVVGGGGNLVADSTLLTNLDVHSNGNVNQLYGYGIYIHTSNNIIQQSRIYANVKGGLRLDTLGTVSTPINNTIDANIFYANGRSAIDLSGGTGHQVFNNVLYNNVSGISLSTTGEAVAAVSITNNTLVHNTAMGVYVGLGASKVQVVNNLIAHQGDSGLYILSLVTSGPILLSNNLLYANTGLPNGQGQEIFDINNAATSANNILEQDPHFTGYQADGTGDYHLTAGSPAINAGASQGAPSVDFDGNPRPHGSGFDIGAYEFLGPYPTPTPLIFLCVPAIGPSMLGTPYSSTCTVSGGIPPYTFTPPSNLPAGLAFSSTTLTATVSGTPTAAGNYAFAIGVQDSGAPPQSTDNPFLGTIQSSLVIISTSLPNGIAGFTYFNPDLPGNPPVALEATGGVAPYSWSVISGSLPPGLSLSTEGVFSGTFTALGTYPFTVRVQDSAGNTTSQALSIDVPLGTLVFTCAPAIGPQLQGATYSSTCLATNGTPPYTFSASGLPIGLTLSDTANTATISGIPLSTGPYAFIVEVKDSGTPQQSVSAPFLGTLQSGLVITSTDLPAGIVGQFYSAALQASGGVTPYVWSVSSGTLPTGFSMTSDGLISGTPTAAGSSSFTIQVQDNSGIRAIQSFSINVSSAVSSPASPDVPIIVGFVPTIPGIVDRSATFHLNVVGSWTSMDWTFTSVPPASAVDRPAGTEPTQASGQSYTATTQAASLGLSALPLALGPQHLIVVVHNGTSSASISADFNLTSSDLAAINVHPSPWRSDRGWSEQITFDNVPPGSSVKIFTMSAHWVATVTADANSQAVWNLKNDSGNLVASGIYIYLVTDVHGGKAHGKFGIIR